MQTQDDAFHSGAKPQEHLKGGQEPVHTQMPQASESMTNPRSAAPDNIGTTWNTSSLESTPAPNKANRNPVH